MSAALKPSPEAPLIRLRDLHVKLESRDRTVHAVNGVDLDLAAGEVLCILGESGSGKSVTLRALMKLLPKTAKVTGEIQVAGRDVQAMNEGQLADFRGGDVAMIFQEPMTALDPVFTIGRQIAETVQRHEGASRSAADARARISCQWPLARKRGLADQLIDNRGSVEQLHTLLQDLTDPAAGPLSR